MVASEKASMKNSRGWDFFMTAYWQFDYDSWYYQKLRQGGVTGDALEAAGAEVIESYLDVRYAAELFLASHYANRVEGFLLVNTDIWEMVLLLDDEFLKSAEAQEWQAADNMVSSRITKVKKFNTDVIKMDLFVGNIWQNEEMKTVRRAFTDRLRALDDYPDGVDEDEIKFINGPDYKSSESMEWEILKRKLDEKRKAE